MINFCLNKLPGNHFEAKINGLFHTQHAEQQKESSIDYNHAEGHWYPLECIHLSLSRKKAVPHQYCLGKADKLPSVKLAILEKTIVTFERSSVRQYSYIRHPDIIHLFRDVGAC